MYNTQSNPWYSPYQSSRQQMMMPDNVMPMMMPGGMKQMMNMMREHIRITDDIRRVVYEINERCKRMEEKMNKMEGKMMM